MCNCGVGQGCADPNCKGTPEQGKPEPEVALWMRLAHRRIVGDLPDVRGIAQVIAECYAASQPLVPQRSSPTFAERAAQMLDSLSAHGFLAIDDSEKLENAAAIIVAVLRAMQLEPLVPQQEPTNNVSKDTPALRLLRSCEIDETVLQMSNEQLADVLLNRVWAGMDMTSAESSFVSAAIDRLKLGGVPSEQGTPPQSLENALLSRLEADFSNTIHEWAGNSGMQASIGALRRRVYVIVKACLAEAADSQSTGWVDKLYRSLESYHAEATSKGRCPAGASCECRWHRAERILREVHGELALPTPPSGEKT